METIQYIKPILSLSAIGFFFGIVLGFAAKKLKVKEDPKIAKLIEVLPGVNCGACGKAGCAAFAESLVNGESVPSACIPGGAEVVKKVSAILGVAVTDSGIAKVAVVQCGGSKDKAKDRFIYNGMHNCKSASLVWGGNKACTYGCLGLGSCQQICPFSAIVIENGLARVLEDKCTGCGKCINSCPRLIIKLIPRTQKVYVNCVSQDKLQQVKEVCQVGCIGCTLCVKLTKSNAIVMKGNLPEISEKWDDYEAAVAKCPTKCFVVRETSALVAKV